MPIAILIILFSLLFIFNAKWEERELTERFGEEYKEYKRKVPFIIPRWKRKTDENKLHRMKF